MGEPIAVLGAGNGGCAAAAELSLRGWDVTLYNRSEGRLAPLREQGGVALNDPEARGVVPIRAITRDLGAALDAANHVVMMLPTTTLSQYAVGMAPHLTADHRVLVAPGHTGGAMAFARAVAEARGTCPYKLAETHTLPYICRMTGPGEVTVWKRSDRLLFAGLPAVDTDELLDAFADAFPALVPASSVLETSLSNLNAVMHAGPMVLNAGWIEHTGGDFRFYAEGTTPAVGRVVETTDDERLAIGDALGLRLQPFLDAFHSSGYATVESWNDRDVYRAIKDSPPNSRIMSPSSLDHRYLHEDVGYGLVPMIAMATVAGVSTPTMSALVHLAGVALGVDLAREGLNATRLGIEGMGPEALRSYAAHGLARAA